MTQDTQAVAAQATETMDAELLALAKKEQEKRKARMAKAKENAGSYGPWVNADSIEFDESANKLKVECTCTRTGTKFWSYTSDLFQIQGLCPAERAKDRNAAKASKQARVKAGLALLAEQEAANNHVDEDEDSQLSETEKAEAQN